MLFRLFPWIKRPNAVMYVHQGQLIVDRTDGPRLVLRPEMVRGMEYQKIDDGKTTVWYDTDLAFTLNMSPPSTSEVLRQAGVWSLDELPHDA